MEEARRFSWRTEAGTDRVTVEVRQAGLAWTGEHLGPAGGPYTIGAQGLRDLLDAGPLEPTPPEVDEALRACVREALARGEGPVLAWTPERLAEAPERGWIAVRDAWGRTALDAAVRVGREDLVRALLDAGADPSAPTADGSALVCAAAAEGAAGIVTALLRAGAAPAHGALHRAIYACAYHREAPAAIAALLDAGADLEDRYGPLQETPLVLALRHGRFELAETLLARGARLDWRGSSGQGALIAVATQPEALSWLLARGAPVDDADRDGRTALWHATRANARGAVRVLLDAGADPGRAPR